MVFYYFFFFFVYISLAITISDRMTPTIANSIFLLPTFNFLFIIFYFFQDFNDILLNKVALQSISVPNISAWLVADSLHKANYFITVINIAQYCSHNISWFKTFDEKNF